MRDPGLSDIEIKKLLDKVYYLGTVKTTSPILWVGPSLLSREERENFKYYHLNRNKFNVKQGITILVRRCEGGDTFEDNFGDIWTEQSLLKNQYHMPDEEFDNASKYKFWENPGVVPYSRKFLRDDPGILQGEFELIIHRNRERIDGGNEKRVKYQETYNFGRTRYGLRHIYLDVNPHKKNSNYVALEKDMGSVTIYDTILCNSPEPFWANRDYSISIRW